jgi:phospholipid-binding lipoprotein MlaA
MKIRSTPFASMTRLQTLLVMLTLLAGCASVGSNTTDEYNDPLEPLNRQVFAFNRVLDRLVVKPAARGYRALLPQFVRDRIRSMIDNLGEPLIFVNDLLQLRIDAAGTTLGRFVINSTVGVAGMFDRATTDGFQRQTGDFGQTLYRWGVDDGPYLVLPFFGPSNVRDTVGLGVDLVASPVGYAIPHDQRVKVGVSIFVVNGIDQRERNLEAFDLLEQSALDFYVHLRSVWRQHRASVLDEARKRERPEELIDPEGPAR